MAPDADLLDTGELAAWIRVKPSTLRTWRTRGGGPVATLVGRKVFYRRRDVEAWLDDRRSERTAVAS